MKTALYNSFFVIFAVVIFSGCISPAPNNQLTRWIGGKNNGDSSLAAYQLRNYGNFAAGSLAYGTGDVIFDGMYYYRLVSGKATMLTSTLPLNSAWAVRFRADRVDQLNEVFDLAKLSERIDVLVTDKTMPCVFRLIGIFDELSVRIDNSDTGLQLGKVAGFIYGYRAPSVSDDTEMSLWFLANNTSMGGRVVSFKISGGSLAVDICPRSLMIHTCDSAATKQLRKFSK